jgi:hypothetical protein
MTISAAAGPLELLGLQCVSCRHFRDVIGYSQPDPGVEGTVIFGCAAFPKGIPPAIWSDRVDHRRPYRGDRGIRWEPTNPGVEALIRDARER